MVSGIMGIINPTPPGKPPVVFKPNLSIGNKIPPAYTTEIAQQQVQQAKLQGLYGRKNMKKGSKKKETEKNENGVWDTGFGEVYESIEDRKVKKMFKSMDELLEEK